MIETVGFFLENYFNFMPLFCIETVTMPIDGVSHQDIKFKISNLSIIICALVGVFYLSTF